MTPSDASGRQAERVEHVAGNEALPADGDFRRSSGHGFWYAEFERAVQGKLARTCDLGLRQTVTDVTVAHGPPYS